MAKSSFKKGITLLSSLSLVTLFLLYRIGAFDKSFLSSQGSLLTSHNGGNIISSSMDTTKSKKDNTKPLMLSSSKVLILTDIQPNLLDSLKKKPATYKYPKREIEILSSSKSTIIFKPKQIFKITLDSLNLKYDTSKTTKKKGK